MESSTLAAEDKRGLVILAVAQSLLLLFLHKSIVNDFWPSADISWLYALYTFAIGVPIFIYLGVDRLLERRTAIVSAVLGIVLLIIGFHSGWLMEPANSPLHRHYDTILVQMIFGGGTGLFLLSLYYRSWRQAPDEPLSYARLIENSWLNALTGGFLLLFIGVFWLLLVLWAQLFVIINIEFFEELFERSEFIYPVTGLVGGFGLVLIRGRVNLIATVRRLCETLIRALLPLAAVIGLLFIVFLPFTGVGTLWEDGPGSALLVGLLLVTLFFFNAELGDSGDGGYPRALRWLVLLAMVALPVMSALAAWGLWVRVGEYGWTVGRLWALFIEFFLAAYAIGYATLILRYRSLPLAQIRRWNTWLGLALGAALLIVQGPLVDFRRITANDQVDRLVSGETRSQDFDVRYLRTRLGRYGTAALERVKENPELAADVALMSDVESALAAENYGDFGNARKAELWKKMIFVQPEGAPPAPAGMKETFATNYWQAQICADEERHCVAFPLDFDGVSLWIIYSDDSGSAFQLKEIYAEIEGEWQSAGRVEIERVVGEPADNYTTAPERIDAPIPVVVHNGWALFIYPDKYFLREVGVLPQE